MKNSVIGNMVKDYEIPPMAKVKQVFPRQVVEDVEGTIGRLFIENDCSSMIKPGMRIAVTCGSRGVSNLKQMVRSICLCVKNLGGEPFIVPSMGSHGGANAKGQREIIESYGVTEEYCGAPIVSCMDTKYIGDTEDGRPVYIDKNAAEADGIILLNRIKAHTDFRGPYESGLMKMMVIGLGKQKGAENFHKEGPSRMGYNIPMFGKAIIKHAPILFGIAFIENAYDETAIIELLKRDVIEFREPELLIMAKEMMAKCYIKDVDLLIVDKIGKDISGDGMDPNITGRFCNPYVSGGMNVHKMVILDLTENTHGQMAGLGYGDITTRRCVEKCDFEATYPNALTSTTFTPFRVPIVAESDHDAIAACLKYMGGGDAYNPRIVRIKDTLHMDEILVSEALLDFVEKHPNMNQEGPLQKLEFNSEGNLW